MRLRSRHVRGACAIAVLALWAAYSLHDLPTHLPYPTRDDQMDNLEQARTFVDRFVFYWRGPLYVAWLGVHLRLSGGDPETCLYFEKITSVLLLAALMAWLGQRLWGWRAAVLMSAWTINCAWLIRQPTNNHTLAASLFAISLICLTSPTTRRVPFALLALLLATQVRPEMWLVFGAATFLLVAWKVSRGPGALSTPRAWTVAVLAGGLVLGTIAVRSGPPFPIRANFAFGQTFAKNYVERHRLEATYPDAWTSFYEVLRDHVPALTPVTRMSPLSALRHYPREFGGHLLHNARLAALYVPATILSLERPLLMLVIPLAVGLCLAGRPERRRLLRWAVPPAALIALVLASTPVSGQALRHPVLSTAGALAYAACLAHVIVRDAEGSWRHLGAGRRRLVLVWASLPLLILPPLLVFRVGGRYLVPLIPAGIFWAASLGEAVWLTIAASRREAQGP